MVEIKRRPLLTHRLYNRMLLAAAIGNVLDSVVLCEVHGLALFPALFLGALSFLALLDRGVWRAARLMEVRRG